MYKSYFILALLCISVGLSAQKSTLLKNRNFRAKELKHKLNKSGDSLILECNKIILNVEIFNNDFSKSINVDSTKTKISITDTPLGRLVVQARLPDKRIIMTLIRHEAFNNIDLDSDLVEVQPAKIKKPDENDVTSMLNWKRKITAPLEQKFYWIIKESNSGNGSYKSMKLVNGEKVQKIIEKIKAELETQQGKLNKLLVWEVYDTTRFMEEQVANPNYIFSKSSNFFNTTPYFDSNTYAK